jgi:hypothetical protein
MLLRKPPLVARLVGERAHVLFTITVEQMGRLCPSNTPRSRDIQTLTTLFVSCFTLKRKPNIDQLSTNAFLAHSLIMNPDVHKPNKPPTNICPYIPNHQAHDCD